MSGMSHRFLGINQCSVELIHMSSSKTTKRCRQWGSNQGPIDWTLCHYTTAPQSRSDRPKHFRQLSSVDVQAAQVARFRLETAGTRLTTKPYEFANAGQAPKSTKSSNVSIRHVYKMGFSPIYERKTRNRRSV